MNKYYKLLAKILKQGEEQKNKKGDIKYLLNEVLSMNLDDVLKIITEHPIAKKKLSKELELYCKGITSIKEYNAAGITWWDYCTPNMLNTYPTYFKKLPSLIEKINKEKRPSKNYMLFIGETGVETSQLPCLSLIQFQISNEKLHITVYQRSADSNLGLPSDIYHTLLISKMIDIPLANITFFIGNAHIYSNNIDKTKQLLEGDSVKFQLNV
jgi:thymidylate synthase|tara:strand:+ start:412 stop:1047 length:636 start_codon:yes stop_codon:yes gene_type:complete